MNPHDARIAKITKEFSLPEMELYDAPYSCPCGHEGRFQEILDNDWKCQCGWSMWVLKKNNKNSKFSLASQE